MKAIRTILLSLAPLLLAAHGGQYVPTAYNAGASGPVSGMSLWFSADCITYTSSVCGTPSNGTSISSWADRSGNANNWTKSSGTCTFNTNQVNSKPAVTFSSCYGNFGTIISASSGHTAFLVYQTSATSGIYIFGSSNLGGFGWSAAWTTGAQELDKQNQTALGVATNHVTSGSWTQINTLMQNAASGFIMDFRMSSAVDTLSSSTSADISVNGPSGMGADMFNNSAPFSGQAAEIMYYNTTLTLTQIQQNEAYFRSKYGVS